MTQHTKLEAQVQSWIKAGLIDAQTGARILAFEAGQEQRASVRWPALLALAFGGILLAAGVTLFVAAHWDQLSPAMRFSLVLSMVGVFHVAGAVLADRFPPLSTSLHAVGTATLGAAIFLTGQIFNLQENWPTGILLWAIGAAIGYVLFRVWAQAASLALLVPAWLFSQWEITTDWFSYSHSSRPLAMGLILTAICYLSARMDAQENPVRRALVWIGGIAVVPCVATAIVGAIEDERASWWYPGRSFLPLATSLIGWTVALVGPLVIAWLLRGRAAWINLLWAAWAYALILSASHSNSYVAREHHRKLGVTLVLYALCALGSVGMVAWGLYEKRKERLNLGIAGFAISVLFFYFDSFMDKLGRSASLLILGVLCLAGGYALEVTRRKLTARMEMGP